jgi:DNA-binding beta-propeller fold protein YncE
MCIRRLAGMTVLLVSLAACGSLAERTPPLPLVANPGQDRLYVRDGAQGLAVIDAATGRRERALPMGLPAPDWSALYTLSYGNGQTALRAFDVRTGGVLRETRLEGIYDFPNLDLNGMPAGLSPDGRWLALYGRQGRDDQKSRYAVVDTTFSKPAKSVQLDRTFYFDALNNSGSLLYLIEPLSSDLPAKYQVRAYDLAQGNLRAQAIVDKVAAGPVMQGTRHTAIASPSGEWLYSLYFSPRKGPFVHALNMPGGFSTCIFLLPANEQPGPSGGWWSLAMNRDGGKLYAANAGGGKVVEIDTRGLRVSRTGNAPRITASTRMSFGSAAYAKEGLGVGLALTPDGGTLFVLADRLVAYNTRDLSVRGSYLAGWSFSDVTVSPSGEALYAVTHTGMVVRVDLPDAHRVDPVFKPVSPFGPWSVLRVESASH